MLSQKKYSGNKKGCFSIHTDDLQKFSQLDLVVFSFTNFLWKINEEQRGVTSIVLVPGTQARWHYAIIIWTINSWDSSSQNKTLILQITNAREGVEKREPSYTVGGNVNWCSHYGKQYGGSLKN